MGPFSLLGLNRPSRQPASSFEGKCAAYLLQAPMVYPPQATPCSPLGGVGMGKVFSQALP